MYIQNSEVAHFFGINSSPGSEKIEAFSRELTHYPDSEKEGIILLGKEKSLYTYPPREVYDVYQKIERDIMLILCSRLSNARGSERRSWENTQNNISNFNINICLLAPVSLTKNLWDLQERISVAIANVLINYSGEQTIGISYPFHYTLNGGKVAGHLVQKMNIDKNSSFLRIGIGVNTADIAPELPQNDDLANHLFGHPTTIQIPPEKWINLAINLSETIESNISHGSKHDEYLEYLNLKTGDQVSLYNDDGTTSIRGVILTDRFRTIDPTGNIITDSHIILGGSHHIMKH